MKIILSLLVFAICVFAQKISIFEVKGMHCPLCTTAVKKAIRTLDGIEKVSAKLSTKKVTVTYDEKKVTIEEIQKAIKKTSYEGILIK